jgi:hypothetical protein
LLILEVREGEEGEEERGEKSREKERWRGCGLILIFRGQSGAKKVHGHVEIFHTRKED